MPTTKPDMTTQALNPTEAANTPSGSSESAILASAERLFSEQGYDAISMSAIAKDANTSKANIYHHFKSKHHLYLAVLDNAAAYSAELLDRLEDEPGTFESKLRAFASGQLNSILTHENRSQLLLREALSKGSERGKDVIKHAVGESFSRLVEMISKGQQQGEFQHGPDPALAAFLVVSSNVFFFQSREVMQHLPDINFTENADEFSADMMDLLFKGVLNTRDQQS